MYSSVLAKYKIKFQKKKRTVLEATGRKSLIGINDVNLAQLGFRSTSVNCITDAPGFEYKFIQFGVNLGDWNTAMGIATCVNIQYLYFGGKQTYINHSNNIAIQNSWTWKFCFGCNQWGPTSSPSWVQRVKHSRILLVTNSILMFLAITAS